MSEISCEEVLSEIEHYLHGELGPDRSAHLAEHLGGCGDCLGRADFQRKLKEIVRTKCRTETPEHLMDRIRQGIRAAGPHAPGGPS